MLLCCLSVVGGVAGYYNGLLLWPCGHSKFNTGTSNPFRSLPIMDKYVTTDYRQLWQSFEETSGYVRLEEVNKWPNSMTDI